MIIFRNLNIVKTSSTGRIDIARQMNFTISNASSFALIFSSRVEIEEFSLALSSFAQLDEYVLSGQYLLGENDLANPLTLKNRGAIQQRVQVISSTLLSSFNSDIKVKVILGMLLKQRGATFPIEIQDYLNFVQLDAAILEARIATLSAFERIKVLLLLATCTQAEFLIFEELEVQLDDTELEELLNIVRQYQINTGASCLYLTTDVFWTLRHCDEVAIVEAGLILESGSAIEISRKPLHPMTLAMMQASFARGFSPVGCPYVSECKAKLRVSENLCATTLPVSISITDTHMVRCHLSAEERIAYSNEVQHGRD